MPFFLPSRILAKIIFLCVSFHWFMLCSSYVFFLYCYIPENVALRETWLYGVSFPTLLAYARPWISLGWWKHMPVFSLRSANISRAAMDLVSTHLLFPTVFVLATSAINVLISSSTARVMLWVSPGYAICHIAEKSPPFPFYRWENEAQSDEKCFDECNTARDYRSWKADLMWPGLQNPCPQRCVLCSTLRTSGVQMFHAFSISHADVVLQYR